MATTPPVNPYAKGISFGGQNVQPVYNAATGTWGVPVAGGFAPIYNAQQFGSLLNDPNVMSDPHLKGMANEAFGISAPAGAQTNPFAPGTYLDASGNAAFQTTSPGQTLAINGSGKKTDVGYRLDPNTGDYIPSGITGTENTAPGFVDNLIKYGSIIGGSVIGGLGSAGTLGAGDSALSLAQSGLTSGVGAGSGAGSIMGGLGSAAAAEAPPVDPGIANPTTNFINPTPGQIDPGMAGPLNLAPGAGGSGGSSLLSQLNQARQVAGGLNSAKSLLSGGSQPNQGSSTPNLGALLAAGGLGAVLASMGGSGGAPGASSSGSSATSMPGGSGTPAHLPPPPSWSDFMSRVGAPQAGADPGLAAMLGLQPNDIAMRSMGVPAAPQGGLSAAPPVARPPMAQMPVAPPTGAVPGPNQQIAGRPMMMADGGTVQSQQDPMAGMKAWTDVLANRTPDPTGANMTPLQKLVATMKSYGQDPNQAHGGGGGMNDATARLAQLGIGMHPNVMRGGLQMARGGHLSGPGGGQADTIDAKLSDGEYVMDADVVSALGDGNNAAGAAKLDQMREKVRAHKRSAPSDKIPPKAKEPAAYLGKRK